jgi:hypothetical protein
MLHERCVNGTVIFPDRDLANPSAGLGIRSPRSAGRGKPGGGGPGMRADAGVYRTS